MTRNEEILAGVTAASPAIRANFQGQLGYWCQAEAVFIADEGPRPEPGRAIAAYRQRLSEAHIAVNYNGYTDAIERLMLQAGVTKLQAALAAAQAQAAAAEAREARLRQELQEAADECKALGEEAHGLRVQLRLASATNTWVRLEDGPPPTFVSVLVACDNEQGGLTTIRRAVQWTGDGWRYTWTDEQPAHELKRTVRYWRYHPLPPAAPAAAEAGASGGEGVGRGCLSSCQAGRDGDCIHAACPQLRDKEPEATGRGCPLPYYDDDED